MSKKPLISIITVNLNDLEGLQRTMKSVFDQTWQDFEFIIIDGGSKDGSAEFLKTKDSEINKWVSEQDTGIYNAMNKGIRMAAGEYLLFLNSGDELINSDVLRDHHFNLSGKDLIYFNINVIDKKKSIIKKCPEVMTFSYLCEDTIPHQSIFLKKILFEKIGFYDDTLKIVADWKFIILALCKYNATYKYVNDVISNYYFDGVSSHSSSWPVIVKERTEVLNTEFRIMMEDYEKFAVAQKKLARLRSARKIQLLIRFGLLNRF